MPLHEHVVLQKGCAEELGRPVRKDQLALMTWLTALRAEAVAEKQSGHHTSQSMPL